MLKYRIFSFIFLVLSVSFCLIFLREKSNHNTLKIEADGCQAHKDLIYARSKKAFQELADLNKSCKKTIEDLKKPTQAIPAPAATDTTAENLGANAPAPTPLVASPVLVEARTSAIGKIIQLTPAQKTALTAYFSKKLIGEMPEQTFEDIIGTENVDFYKQQVQKSFARARTEAVEKEAFYIGAKLGLANDQVRNLISIMQQIQQGLPKTEEVKISQELTSREAQLEALKNQIERDAAFQKELDQQITAVLTEEQQRKYHQLNTERTSSDLELWH